MRTALMFSFVTASTGALLCIVAPPVSATPPANVGLTAVRMVSATVEASASFDPGGPEEWCRGYAGLRISVTGRLTSGGQLDDLHLRLSGEEGNTCFSHEDETFVDEALRQGAFQVGRGGQWARLDADVTFRAGYPFGGTSPGHITIVWDAAGPVRTEVSRTSGPTHRGFTVTRSRAATVDMASDYPVEGVRALTEDVSAAISGAIVVTSGGA